MLRDQDQFVISQTDRMFACQVHIDGARSSLGCEERRFKEESSLLKAMLTTKNLC